jgi:hypothetical protein
MSTADREFLSDLYDSYRTSLMNMKYYGLRLSAFQRLNLMLELVVAIGASASVAGWAIWKIASGSVVWAVIAGTSALLAVIKPIAQISKQVERYSKLHSGHADVSFDLEALIREIRADGAVSDPIKHTYSRTMERIRVLVPQDDPRPSRKLLKKCFDEVNREIDVRDFWLPKEG